MLCGDATDEELLQQENIDEMDLFLALTNDDEDNIMGAALAKRLGCQRVVALINRRAYAELVQGGPIDIGSRRRRSRSARLLAYVRQRRRGAGASSAPRRCRGARDRRPWRAKTSRSLAGGSTDRMAAGSRGRAGAQPRQDDGDSARSKDWNAMTHRAT